MKVQLDMSVDAVSESARAPKLPGMITPMVNRVRTLVVPSSKKPDVAAATAAIKEMKTLILSACKSYAASNAARKESLAQDKKKVPDFKKIKELDKTAGAKHREAVKTRRAVDRQRKLATSILKKAGLTGLFIPIAPEHLTGMDKTPAKIETKIKAVKPGEFGVVIAKRRISYLKPKFAADAKFETMAQTLADKEAGKKPAVKEAVKARKGAITGAATPAKQRALKARQRGESPKAVAALMKRPKNEKAHAEFMNRFREEEKVTTKSLKKALGTTTLSKADMKKMSYSFGKNHSLQLIDKNGKEHNFTKAALEKHGLQIDDVTGLLGSNDAHQHNITVPDRNPEYGAAKKKKK